MANTTAYAIKNGSTLFADHLRFDALAIVKSWVAPCFIGYEIKTTKSDFSRDVKWPGYFPYVHEFNFVVPSGLVGQEEIDPQVGLIYYNPETHRLTTRRKAVHRLIEPDPNLLLYVIMNRVDSERMPFETDKADTFRAWLEEKQTTRELGRKVKGKLIYENAALLDRIKEMEFDLRYKAKFDALIEVMEKHRIRTRWREESEALDEALSEKSGIFNVDDLLASAESLVLKLKELKGGAE
jgi:hypothetical protein